MCLVKVIWLIERNLMQENQKLVRNLLIYLFNMQICYVGGRLTLSCCFIFYVSILVDQNTVWYDYLKFFESLNFILRYIKYYYSVFKVIL